MIPVEELEGVFPTRKPRASGDDPHNPNSKVKIKT